MLPWLILGGAAVLVLIIGGGVMRSTRQAEHPAGETAEEQARTEREFEDAERYQEQWRKEHHKELEDEPIP